MYLASDNNSTAIRQLLMSEFISVHNGKYHFTVISAPCWFVLPLVCNVTDLVQNHGLHIFAYSYLAVPLHWPWHWLLWALEWAGRNKTLVGQRKSIGGYHNAILYVCVCVCVSVQLVVYQNYLLDLRTKLNLWGTWNGEQNVFVFPHILL